MKNKQYIRFYSGVVEEVDEGDAIAKALGDKKVIILQNHGILTTGSSVDIALWFYLSMERCCQAQLMAEAAGKPELIPHDAAIKTRENLYQMILLLGQVTNQHLI